MRKGFWGSTGEFGADVGRGNGSSRGAEGDGSDG